MLALGSSSSRPFGGLKYQLVNLGELEGFVDHFEGVQHLRFADILKLAVCRDQDSQRGGLRFPDEPQHVYAGRSARSSSDR